MIAIRCESRDSLRLRDMRPFQGDLKRRSKAQARELEASLVEEGLLAPFFIWRGTDDGGNAVNWLLDGHARWEALKSLSETGEPEMFSDVEFPVVYIEAGSVDEAKKALLQITSQYGRVTKDGALNFCASIPGYRAPSVRAFLKKAGPVGGKAVPMREASAPPLPEGEVKMTIAVPKAYEKAVRDLFASVSYIRVL